MKKVSILTPTYNDAESFEETYQSVISQTYENWQWIIVNDGSSDNTVEVVGEKAKEEKRITFISQENGDQLNALLNGLNYVDGDYIFILHSDDLLPTPTFFQDCVEAMRKNVNVDGLFGDLEIINEKSEKTGMQKVRDYKVEDNVLALQLLWLGRNLYSDVAFHKTEVFKKYVKKNYLTWNCPLWMNFEKDNVNMLHYKKVSFPVLKYRVHEGNYINNELGKMNVINGELRVATRLMKFYSITNYEKQYLKFRLKNKLFNNYDFKVKYEKKETSNKYEVLSFIVGKRYDLNNINNLFIESVLAFYKNKNTRTLTLEIPKDVRMYYGKDVRFFNKALLNDSLPSFYMNFMEEMKKGFSKIEVNSLEEKEKAEVMINFFCIDGVEVEQV